MSTQEANNTTKVLVINSLDLRYGSTYRLRAIYDSLSGPEKEYVESEKGAWSKLFLAIRAAMTRDYDLLFTQKFNPITIAALMIARLRGAATIVDWDDLDQDLQDGALKKFLARFCEATGPIFADQITTHNEGILQRAKKMRKTVTLLSQGFDEALFFPRSEEEKSKFRSEYGFSDRDFLVGHLCTFTSGGTLDLELILEAWSKVQNKRVRFILIGGGPLEEDIRKKIERFGLSDRLTLTGLLPQSKVGEILNALDLGIIFMSDRPGNRARLSFKVIEYLASGIPVLGRLEGETARLFSNWVHEVSEEDFSQKIDAFASSPPEPPKAALENYSWNVTLKPLGPILHNLTRQEMRQGEKQCR